MDAGLAALGQGWPIAAGPRSRAGAGGCRALARHRTPGARALGYLGPGGVPFFQVTRRKGETISDRYRRNGYVLSHKSPLAARTPSPASLAPKVKAKSSLYRTNGYELRQRTIGRPSGHLREQARSHS